MANDVMIDRVLAQILYAPETHNQDTWAKEDECGTTRCVAGWAVYFSDDYFIQKYEWQTSGQPVRVSDGSTVLWSEAGADVLGIDLAQADYLFFETNNEQAVDFLKELKNN